MSRRNRKLLGRFSFFIILIGAVVSGTAHLQAGELDDELRAATQLVPGDEVGVIVRYGHLPGSEDVERIHRLDGRVYRRFDRLGMLAVKLSMARVQELSAQPGVIRVSMDSEVSVQGPMPASGKQVAEEVEDGPQSAIFDSVAPLRKVCHPAGEVRLVESDAVADDSSDHPKYDGCAEVIPGVGTWEVQVFDAQGKSRVSTVLAGLEWVLDHADAYNIRALALWLDRCIEERGQEDPLVQAAGRLWDSGVAVMIPVDAYRMVQKLALSTSH